MAPWQKPQSLCVAQHECLSQHDGHTSAPARLGSPGSVTMDPATAKRKCMGQAGPSRKGRDGPAPGEPNIIARVLRKAPQGGRGKGSGQRRAPPSPKTGSGVNCYKLEESLEGKKILPLAKGKFFPLPVTQGLFSNCAKLDVGRWLHRCCHLECHGGDPGPTGQAGSEGVYQPHAPSTLPNTFLSLCLMPT